MSGPSIQSFSANGDQRWNSDPTLCPACTCVVNDAIQGRISWDHPPSKWKHISSSQNESVSATVPVTSSCHLCTMLRRELRNRYIPESMGYGIEANKGSDGSLSVYTRQGSEDANDKKHKILKFQLYQIDKKPSSTLESLDAWNQSRYIFPSEYHDRGPPVICNSRALLTPESTALAREWLAECSKSHETCEAVRGRGILPKRVLDLATSDEDVKLYVTNGETVPYATLSYCWGSARSLKTLRTNLEAHCHGISINIMPATLQDSIHLARALGFRYLWIDALCIIQDDPTDWAEQSATMTDIYQGCTVNIAALDALESDQGLFPKLSNHSCVVASSADSDDAKCVLALIIPPPYSGFIGDRQLGIRGWVFQETLVSAATLRCMSEGMQWECCSACYRTDGSSTSRGGALYPVKSQGDKEGWADIVVKGRSESPSEPKPTYTWNQYVSEFSRRRLSEPKDKLPAVAGIAARFSYMFNLTYAAGLWREHFLSGLTWGCSSSSQMPAKRLDRAPSWSWASMDGPVTYPHIFVAGTSFPGTHRADPEVDLQVDEFRVVEKHAGSFGELEWAEVDVQGRLLPITINGDKNDSWTSDIGKFGTMYPDQKFDSGRTADQTWCLRIASFRGGSRRRKPHREGPFEFFLVVERAEDAGEGFYRRVRMIMTDHSPPKRRYGDPQGTSMEENVKVAFEGVPTSRLTLI